MRKCDNAATRDLGLPVELLMEHAGAGVVAALERRSGPLAGRSVVVVCGKGNNGGDGLVVARLLALRRAEVSVVLCARMRELNPLARKQARRFQLLLDQGGFETCRLLEVPSGKSLNVLPSPDFVLDAVFGTGFAGRSKGAYARAIDWMNRATGMKVALDVPSGLNADTGAAEGAVFRADLTITFQARKTGLMLCQGSTYAGDIEVVDIGMPAGFLRRHAVSSRMTEAEDVRLALPARPHDAHKHSVGKVLVVAGAVGFAGAAIMTASAAMRAGAGAVILCSPRSLYAVLAKRLTEVMVMPLSESPGGCLAPESLGELAPQLDWADVVVVGPGLTRDPGTVRVVRELSARVRGKLLLDADGINAFAGNPELFRKFRCSELVLTPHAGEFSRLSGYSAREIESRRNVLAGDFARTFKATVVLKGAPTVTASKAGPIVLNPTGNPGMATAGAGDILTGILGGLWAQGMDATSAAFSAVYLHGMAGDLAKERLGERSLLALDILQEFPRALRAVETGRATGA
jgi:NAD(P)H-hydrate epimerase